MLAAALACACLVPGCAQPGGGLLARHTTIGSLKASVSQLEFEKHQLGRKVANLEAENQRIEGRLTQEESANGELTARLDDARVMLRSRGFDTDSLAGPTRSTQDDSDFDERPRTTPAGRGQRSGRRPPFARIPGHIDPVPNSGAKDDTNSDDPLDAPYSTRSRGDDFGPQSRVDPGTHWRRVAAKTDPYAVSTR
jgi:hypothetical protein